MKVELSLAEITALIATLDGVWSDEQNDDQRSAHDRLESAQIRGIRNQAAIQGERP